MGIYPFCAIRHGPDGFLRVAIKEGDDGEDALSKLYPKALPSEPIPWPMIFSEALLLYLLPSLTPKPDNYSANLRVFRREGQDVFEKLIFRLDDFKDEQVRSKSGQVRNCLVLSLWPSSKQPPDSALQRVWVDIVRNKDNPLMKSSVGYDGFPLWLLEQMWRLLIDQRNTPSIVEIRITNTSTLRCRLEWMMYSEDAKNSWPSVMAMLLETLNVQLVSQPATGKQRRQGPAIGERSLEIYEHFDLWQDCLFIRTADQDLESSVSAGKPEPTEVASMQTEPTPVDDVILIQAMSRLSLAEGWCKDMTAQISVQPEQHLKVAAESLLLEHEWWLWVADCKSETGAAKKKKAAHLLKSLPPPQRSSIILDSLDNLHPALANIKQQSHPLNVFAWEAWPIADHISVPSLRCHLDALPAALEAAWNDLFLQMVGHFSVIADYVTAFGFLSIDDHRRLFMIWFDQTPPASLLEAWKAQPPHPLLNSWTLSD